MQAIHVPGLREAREREARERLAAYLAPLTRIEACDVTIVQLTPRLHLELSASPLTAGALLGQPQFAGIAAMLWRLQPGFRRDDTTTRDAIFQKVGAANAKALLADVRDYIDLTFADQPAAAAQAGNPLPWSWIASIIDVFAQEYHWSRDTVLDSSLRCLFQELRCIIHRRNPKAPFINRHSDRVITRHLCGLNN